MPLDTEDLHTVRHGQNGELLQLIVGRMVLNLERAGKIEPSAECITKLN